jgi:hypothetical protein
MDEGLFRRPMISVHFDERLTRLDPDQHRQP